MKVRVISRFQDKYKHGHFFEVGQEVEFDDERAQNIISRNLGEEVKEEKPKRTRKPKADDE